MTELEEQVLESWRAHNRIMLYVVQHIPADAWAATLSTRGGKGIGGQFAHIYMVRYWKMEGLFKKYLNGLLPLPKGDIPDKERIAELLMESARVVENYLRYAMESDGKIKHFKYKAVPLMAYFVGHEAHHRGNILLTMKKSGFTLGNDLKFGLWDWNHFRDVLPEGAGKDENSGNF